MQIKINPTKVNEDLRKINNELICYIGENRGINFQTVHKDAELRINLNTVTIQANTPIDTTFTSTNFLDENGEILGVSCLNRSFLGKEISLTIKNKTYTGTIEEEETKLFSQK